MLFRSLALEKKNILQQENLFNNRNNQSKLNNNQILSNQNSKYLARVQPSLIVDLEDENSNETTINKSNKQLLYQWHIQTNTITWENYRGKILLLV